MEQVMYFFKGFLGIAVLLGIAVAVSLNRKKISWKMVGMGIGLQFIFALLVLKTKPGEIFFSKINDAVVALLSFSDKGSGFIFGNLVQYGVSVSTKSGDIFVPFAAIFAFKVLPTIIFFSSLISVLYFLGVMQKVVEAFAWIMLKVFGTSGAETLSCSANIFVGQTEAPLLIKPFVETMTQSEILTVMTGGFATVAGGVMAAYVGMLISTFPDIAGHLLSASIMNAPAAIYLSKIILPEEDEPITKGTVKCDLPKTDANIVDAAANGASQGLQLALNVGAMLLAFIALIALIDTIIMGIGKFIKFEHLSLSYIFGLIFAPIAWVMGVPWKDCIYVGSLLGKRLVINEFVTYAQLAKDLSEGILINEKPLEARSVMIAVYAMCGFANFSSIAIQIGGIGGLAPSRRSDIAKLGLHGVIAGTLASFMSATIAGMLVSKARLQLPKAEPKQEPKAIEKSPELQPSPTPGETLTPESIQRNNFYHFAAARLGVPLEFIRDKVVIRNEKRSPEKLNTHKIILAKRESIISGSYCQTCLGKNFFRRKFHTGKYGKRFFA